MAAMNQTKKLYVGGIFIVAIALAFFFGLRTGHNSAVATAPASTLTDTASGQPSGVDFSPFWTAWNIINEKYAGTSTDDQSKVYGAIQGMVASLGDPYTIFFPPSEASVFNSEISGTFAGVGMEVGIKDGKLAVVAPLKGSPAEMAGVKAGDYILTINGTDSTTITTDAAVNLIRGQAGTTVTLTLGRDGVTNPITVKIIRADINVPIVDTTTKGDVYVISLYSFSENSADLFRTALKSFVASGDHKLVIDLRGNPGGYLDAAVDMASWFLPASDIIVQEQFAKGQPSTTYHSKGYNIFSNQLKLVVLVDGGSASAAEILSGALSENGVATLVGEQTFGKGSVQELVSLTPDTSLKVTIAKWLTPKGNWISHKGITPDYIVPMTAADVKANKDPQMDKAVELLSAQP